MLIDLQQIELNKGDSVELEVKSGDKILFKCIDDDKYTYAVEGNPEKPLHTSKQLKDLFSTLARYVANVKINKAPKVSEYRSMMELSLKPKE
jgi:hypothetical protein